ncbi:MAG: hypothetical protein DRN81_05860 [Thermoproteota archaeon]|nr:MAG: hypothetical protein DRN81_05860 [Candidatus Korarchaeota archaeon]
MIFHRLRQVEEEVFWSDCPSRRIIDKVYSKGVRLIVNLTLECTGYRTPRKMSVLHYPIPDFSFIPPEEALYHLVHRISNYIKNGGKVLIHCFGGIGRSGTTVAMLLIYHYKYSLEDALQKVGSLGGGPQCPSQYNAARWFYRLTNLLDFGTFQEIYSYAQSFSFGSGVNHASTVANIALDVVEALKEKYKLDTKHVLSTYLAGLLHDIGRRIDASNHHEVGAELVRKNKTINSITDINIVSCAIYHHRTKTSPEDDVELEEMGFEAKLISSIIRLSDAFINVFHGEGSYLGISLDDDHLVVKDYLVDSERLLKKSKFFTKLTGLEIRLIQHLL